LWELDENTLQLTVETETNRVGGTVGKASSNSCANGIELIGAANKVTTLSTPKVTNYAVTSTKPALDNVYPTIKFDNVQWWKLSVEPKDYP
jgi:hypothetical protein